MLKSIDEVFGVIVGYMWDYFLGFDILFGLGGKVSFPFIILVLALGGFYFTIKYGFINVKLFKHSIDVVRGKYDNPNDEGEISHFKALTSALSATVGLGNIAGVAVAIATGGAGAVFWMWLVAFMGMSMKFSSSTLAQVYRRVKPNGGVLGGPMVYLEEGLKEKGMPVLGKVLAVLFAVLCILGSFGGGNMFQGNQMAKVIGSSAEKLGFFPNGIPGIFSVFLGVVFAAFVGVVIIGGIKRIGAITSKLVPTMVVFYTFVCLVILGKNIELIPGMFIEIFSQAFMADAMWGGFLGVLIQGTQRAAFSNEAGIGSAAIAHAAAKTDEPVREGVVSMLGPFIDTLVVCTMTALALLITGAHQAPGVEKGVGMTFYAFESVASFMPYLLTIAVIIFAFSTMISWSYYGEKATEYLFGEHSIVTYRVVFCLLVALGPILSIGNVLGFSDLSLLSMAFPNILGMLFLSGKVKSLLDTYGAKLKNNEFKVYK
jgi:alanine or glycine:cation symporter, AGCS family